MAYGDCVLCEFANLNCDNDGSVCNQINITRLDLNQDPDFDRDNFMINGSKLCALFHFGISFACA